MPITEIAARRSIINTFLLRKSLKPRCPGFLLSLVLCCWYLRDSLIPNKDRTPANEAMIVLIQKETSYIHVPATKLPTIDPTNRVNHNKPIAVPRSLDKAVSDTKALIDGAAIALKAPLTNCSTKKIGTSSLNKYSGTIKEVKNNEATMKNRLPALSDRKPQIGSKNNIPAPKKAIKIPKSTMELPIETK